MPMGEGMGGVGEADGPEHGQCVDGGRRIARGGNRVE